MNFFTVTGRSVVLPPCSPLLIAVAGCSSSGRQRRRSTVPDAGREGAELCRNLDEELPEKVDGLSADDPEPRSALTAGLGRPGDRTALRCRRARPR